MSVETSESIGAVVALGDSITEGANSTSNTNHRWPDYLAARLNAVNNPVGIRGVVNEGISGNSVLKDYNCCGGNPSGLSRLDRDVISHDGVRTVIVALGINDIGNYPNETVVVEDITDGMRQLADRLHRAGLKVIMATLTPFEDATLAGYYSPEKDAKRMAINQFIRTRAVLGRHRRLRGGARGPRQPVRMLPAYDSGDHLHPNDAGMKALADAVTWLDEPSIPISAPGHDRRRGRARDAGPDARPAAPSGRSRPGVTKDYSASTTATRDLDGGRRGAHGLRPGPPDQRDVLAPVAADGHDLEDRLDRAGRQRGGELGFAQHVDATDALRTGPYSRQLTFTLSTTMP